MILLDTLKFIAYVIFSFILLRIFMYICGVVLDFIQVILLGDVDNSEARELLYDESVYIQWYWESIKKRWRQ